MRFVCPEHGEVKCTRIGYSCPAKGWCPKCGKMLEDQDGGIRVLSADEVRKTRPSYVPDDVLEPVARAICRACEENPDHRGDCRGNEHRWEDYVPIAQAAIEAMPNKEIT